MHQALQFTLIFRLLVSGWSLLAGSHLAPTALIVVRYLEQTDIAE